MAGHGTAPSRTSARQAGQIPAFFKSTKISRQALILKLLVSGGVGCISTHSIIEIMNAEHDISEIDDLYKSHIAALPWVKQPAKRSLAFVQADLCDTVSFVRKFKRAQHCQHDGLPIGLSQKSLSAIGMKRLQLLPPEHFQSLGQLSLNQKYAPYSRRHGSSLE